MAVFASNRLLLSLLLTITPKKFQLSFIMHDLCNHNIYEIRCHTLLTLAVWKPQSVTFTLSEISSHNVNNTVRMSTLYTDSVYEVDILTASSSCSHNRVSWWRIWIQFWIAGITSNNNVKLQDHFRSLWAASWHNGRQLSSDTKK